MNYRRLGRSGIRLSEFGLGSWLTYGRGVDEAESRRCIQRAFELGINFFDTADVYHKGMAEETYGRELRRFNRRDIVIATKCFFPFGDGVNDRGLSRKHISESVVDSLKRLQVDYIDVMQCHRFDPDVEMFEIVRAFDDLIRAGKILYWGVSEWPAAEIVRACAIAKDIGACPPISNQPEYSILARRIETNGVQNACHENGLGMVLWSPLRQGLLSGKYSSGNVPAGSRKSDEKMNAYMGEIKPELTDKIDQLRPLAAKHRCTLAQLAIAWLLGKPAVTSVIIGASRVQQIEENVASGALKLDEADLTAIDRLFPASQYS